MYEIESNIPIPVIEIKPENFRKCNKCASEALEGFKFCQSCRDKNKARKKLNYELNKDAILLRQKEWALNNPDKVKETKKREREKNKDRYSKYWKDRYANNKDEIIVANTKYAQDNKERLSKYRKSRIDFRHANFHKHRANKFDAFVELINRKDVFERDNYICQICKQPTLPNVESSHSLFPTVDHIIPLSKGGTHEYSNVQCAHLGCNSSKGNKIL